MYYGLILLSVAIFGGCFGLDDLYQRRRGTSLRISLEYSLLSALAGLTVLSVINGFRIEVTLFTLIMALLSALTGFEYTFCSFRALRTINLSLYSVFAMLGGMSTKDSSLRIGPKTKTFLECDTFEELFESFKEQIEYFMPIFALRKSGFGST